VTSTADDLAARDKKYVLRPWADDPLMVVDAKDCTVTDAAGKQYIDFTAGYYVNNVGHCHPAVMAAAVAQTAKVTQVSGKNSTPAEVELAERLIQHAPTPIAKVLFTTGGSESNEFAIKLVRQKTGKPAIAALDVGYHGLSLGVLELCGNAKYRATAGVPIGARAVHVPAPYCYRCPHEKDCDTQCLDETERTLAARTDVGALIAEPIQAVGGIIPSQRWWDRMNEIRLAQGMMLIADEVMAGVGRTGKMFSAEHYGLAPDIMTAAKGISGGIGSLGVMMCSEEAATGFNGGTTPTNAANAVSCAAGVALLDVLAHEHLLDNATKMGEYMVEAIKKLDDPWIGDVRFKGLLGGVELVTDRETKAIPARDKMERVRLGLQERGILTTISGPHGNQIRIQPPLTLQAAHVDALAAALFEVLPAVRA
jgi:4-aminobutyrate aminotransferase-like enzyme